MSYSIPQDPDESIRQMPPQVHACLRVWAASMWQAVAGCAWYHLNVRDTEQINDYLWIQDDSPRIGGFRWCCDLLDLDADLVRSAIRHKAREIVHIERRGKTQRWVEKV